MDRVDVHQHLLSEPLIGELARRQSPPMLTRLGGGWTLRVSGEPDSTRSLAATDTAVRGEQLRRDEVDRALVALSTALGIETLPAEESLPLLEAHHRGVEALPAGFGGWGAVQLEAPDPAEVDAVIARGWSASRCRRAPSPARRRWSASAPCWPGSKPTGCRCSSIPARSSRPASPRSPPRCRRG